MGDLTENIFLNATAAGNAEDEELAAFLRYVHSGLAESAFAKEIDDETKRVKNDTDWRERVVTWEMDMRILQDEAREKGRQEGRKEGRQELAETMAAEMIKEGEPLAKIKRYTKLTEAAIHKIAKAMGAAVL